LPEAICDVTRPNPKDDMMGHTKAGNPWLAPRYHDSRFIHPPRGGKTPSGTKRLRKKYIGRLKSEASKQALIIAAELESCCAASPCNSGVCPSCGMAQNQWFRDTAQKLFGDKQLVTFSTVQLSDQRSLPRRLSKLDIDEQHELLGQALQDAVLGSVPFLGAFDFSYNTYPDGS
jgi:hypothetical protein